MLNRYPLAGSDPQNRCITDPVSDPSPKPFRSILSVSKGVVVCSEHIELNFEEIKAMADKLMYADKDEYYRRTGKDRRRV